MHNYASGNTAGVTVGGSGYDHCQVDQSDIDKGLVKGWSAGGQMPPDVAQEIHTVIMTNCIPEAVLLARELRLPPPIPIPQVNVPPAPGKPGKGRSPEIA